MAASGTLFNALLQSTSWNVMPSNCGVRTDRTKPMRCRPGRAPSSTLTPCRSHRTILFELLFDVMSRQLLVASVILVYVYSCTNSLLRRCDGRETQGREPDGARGAGNG